MPTDREEMVAALRSAVAAGALSKPDAVGHLATACGVTLAEAADLITVGRYSQALDAAEAAWVDAELHGATAGPPPVVMAVAVVLALDPGDLWDLVEGSSGWEPHDDGYEVAVWRIAGQVAKPAKVPPHDLMLHAHGHEGNDLAFEPHEHLHTGPGHMGVTHSHRHRHVSPGQLAPAEHPAAQFGAARPVALTVEQARYLSVLAAQDIRRDRERGLEGLPARHEAAWQALQEACQWEAGR